MPNGTKNLYIAGFGTTLTFNGTSSNNNIASAGCKLVLNGVQSGTLVTGDGCTIEGSGFFNGNVILSINNKTSNINFRGAAIIANINDQSQGMSFNSATLIGSNSNDTNNNFYGASLFGSKTSKNGGNVFGPAIYGYSSTILSGNIAAPLLFGYDCSCDIDTIKSIIIAGNGFKIGDKCKNQYSTWIVNSFSGKTVDSITNRKGLILTKATENYINSGLSYIAYWPNNLCYAEHHGNIRYADDMNITDGDGNVIISNGKLNGHLLTDEEYELFQKMKELLNN